MSEKLNPANRVLAALLSEHGRATDTMMPDLTHVDWNGNLDRAAKTHVEETNHDEHHDLHRLVDDGCPHHDDDFDRTVLLPQGPEYFQDRKVYVAPDYHALRRSGYTEKEAKEMIGEAVPAVIQKSYHELAADYRDGWPVISARLPTDAKERKAIPLCTGVLDYFPDALAAIAEVSRIGNDQHNPGQPLHWSKGKSTDHADCALRHFAERGTVDTDGGLHTAKAGWRVLAHLQIEIEAKRAGMSYADYIALLKAQEAA